MQKPVGGQGHQGEVAVSVSGGQELLAAAEVVALEKPSTFLITATLHGAGWGSSTIISPPSLKSTAVEAAVEEAVRPESLPVSSTRFVVPRVKVNLGQTFSVESNVLAFIVIVPDETLN